MCFIKCLCNVIGSNIYDKEGGNNKGKKWKTYLMKMRKLRSIITRGGEGRRGEGRNRFQCGNQSHVFFSTMKIREGIFFAFEKRNGLWTIQLRAMEFHRINQKVIIIVKALFLYLKEGEGVACLFLERMGIASTPPLLWGCFFLIVINPLSSSYFQTSEKYF